MAPSFSLFNQSFDSFGDGNYFSLQNESFGMSRTKSDGGELQQLLHKNSSSLAPSSSGPLTIGYSPVNSFGTATAGRRGSSVAGSTMVLERSERSSPTQVLYRSYSGAQEPPATDEDGTPRFYYVLRKMKDAFKDSSFLLPGLKAAMLEANLDGEAEQVREYDKECRRTT